MDDDTIIDQVLAEVAGRDPIDERERDSIAQVLAIVPGLARPFDVHAGGRGHTHLDLRYLFTADDADPAPPAEESQEVGWYPWGDAPRIAEARMAGILRVLAARFG